MELLAVDVLDRPYWWLVSQDGLQPFPCPACAKRDESATRALSEIQGRALAIAKRLGLRLPASPPYYSVAHDCWRCGSGMVAFVWPEGGGHGDRRPPAPIPASVQHRATDAGDYWANCCPSCSAVQGDHYLSHDNADYVSALALSQEVAG